MGHSKFFLVVLAMYLLACKTDKKESVDFKETKSVLDKIANAHGYENWKNVNSIRFTFNVDRDSTHFERTWQWKPRTNDIISIVGQDTLAYNRATMDSIAYKTNSGFINDRYWILAPFNLIWDQNNFEFEHFESEKAPISKKQMQKLTIVYGSEGGYTPGDAYDFYFEDDFLIREWVFRKANQAEPSMTTTWENYLTTHGFKFALDHKKEEGNFNLYFDGIEIVTED